MHENADPKRVERLSKARQLMADAAALVAQEVAQAAGEPNPVFGAMAETLSLLAAASERLAGPLLSLEHADRGAVRAT